MIRQIFRFLADLVAIRAGYCHRGLEEGRSNMLFSPVAAMIILIVGVIYWQVDLRG